VRLGGGREEFGEAEDAGVVAGLAENVIHARPDRVRLVGRSGDARGRDFDFDAIIKAAEVDLAGRGAIVVEIETHLASGDNGDLKLLDVVVGQARGISKDAHGATGGGGETFVVVEGETKVERILGHGYRLLAQATSQASRQSGQ
jgi:hypothetical protein